MAQCDIKERTRRGGMRNSDGVETVRSHLGKVSLNPLMILVLPSLLVWSECSVSHAFNVELLIALEEELSPHFKLNGYRAGFGSRHDCRNSDGGFGFQQDPFDHLPLCYAKGPGRFAAPGAVRPQLRLVTTRSAALPWPMRLSSRLYSPLRRWPEKRFLVPLPSCQHDRRQIGSPGGPSQHGSAKLWIGDQRRRVAVSSFVPIQDVF